VRGERLKERSAERGLVRPWCIGGYRRTLCPPYVSDLVVVYSFCSLSFPPFFLVFVVFTLASLPSRNSQPSHLVTL
jgi:hypothetical protein